MNIPDQQTVWNWLQDVRDPEVPVLSVIDLGIIRDVRIAHDEVTVVITPTYSGCPANHRTQMDQLGFACGAGSRRSICPCE